MTERLADIAYLHLSVLNSPSTSPSKISEANKALEALKATLTPATALQLCNVLLGPLFASTSSIQNPAAKVQPSLPSIHFAFHIVDVHLLQSAQPWTLFPDDIRSAVRSLAVNIISELQESHPALLRQKAVSLLVALALREWPQRWTDFLDQLLQSSTPILLGCQVLHDLSDQIHFFSDRIHSSRRQELRHSMALSLPQTLTYITRAIETALSQDAHSTIDTLLDCLHSFVHWADLRALFSASVPTACIALLKSIQTRDLALRILDTLVCRQFQNTRLPDPDEDETNKKSAAATAAALNPHLVFREVFFPAMLQFIAEQNSIMLSLIPFSLISPAGAFSQLKTCFETQVSLDSVDEEEFSFFVRVIQVMAQLGVTHFVPTFLYSKRSKSFDLSDADATCAAAFIDLMTICAASPSEAIQLAVLSFVSTLSTALAKHPADPSVVTNDKLIQFIVTAFLQCVAVVQIRPAKSDPLAERFDDLDDLDDTQALNATSLRQRYAAAGSVAARIFPDIAVQLALQRLMRILELKPSPTVVNGAQQSSKPYPGTFRQRGFVVADGKQHGWTFGSFSLDSTSEWLVCAEAACYFVDAVGVGILYQSASEHPTMASAQSQLTKHMLIIFDAVQPNVEQVLIPLKPLLLRVLHPLYMIDEGRLGTCIETLLNMAVSCDKASEKQYSKGFRTKIFSALSSMLRKLGNSSVKGIGRFWKPLCGYASGAMAARELTPMQKINLMESALATVTAVDDVSIQSDGAELVLKPMLDFISREELLSVLRTPVNLLNFLQKGNPAYVEEVCQAFLILEAGVHQIVRPTSKLNTVIPLPGCLSRAIAPKALEISCLLVASLDQIFSNTGAQLGRSNQEMISIIQPTCREACYVLNIDAAENIPKGIGELVEHGGVGNNSNTPVVQDETGVKPSQGEIKSAQILKANGVQPPDEKFSRVRERLRDLRRSGYEIIRAAIFSGAAESDVYVRALVGSVLAPACINKMEPFNAMSLLSRVAAPLLSFPVCETGGTYMQVAGELGLSAFLEHIRELIIGAQRGSQLFSDTRIQDLTREGSRHMIARVAADLIAGMFPRIEQLNPTEKDKEKDKESDIKEKEKPSFLPRALLTPSTRNSVISLWAAICSGINDQGASRAALATFAHAIDLAKPNAENFLLYAPLCDASLKVAVLLRGGSAPADEGAGQAAVTALVGIIRKWPQGFGTRIIEIGGTRPERKDEVTKFVADCVNGISQDVHQSASRAKKHRVFVRTLAERLGDLEGIDRNIQSTVHALPEKLSAVVGVNESTKNRQPLRRKKRDQDELELTDNALDSLFGEGDPL